MSIWNDLTWVEGIRSSSLSIFFENISLAGYPTFLILFISFGYFYWSPSRFSRVAMMLFISGLINAFLKDFFQDARPAIELMLDPKVGTSYGWPSGHSQIAVTLWCLLAYELKNKWARRRVVDVCRFSFIRNAVRARGGGFSARFRDASEFAAVW